MNQQDRVWLWVSAAVSMVMGAVLVLNGTSAGWFLVLLAITYTGASTGAAQKWVTSKPDLLRWGLIGVMFLALLLAVGVVADLLT